MLTVLVGASVMPRPRVQRPALDAAILADHRSPAMRRAWTVTGSIPFSGLASVTVARRIGVSKLLLQCSAIHRPYRDDRRAGVAVPARKERIPARPRSRYEIRQAVDLARRLASSLRSTRATMSSSIGCFIPFC